MTDVWSLLERERLELADFLETLTPDEWEVQSLCSEWKVRDVAGHLCAIGDFQRRRWTGPMALPSSGIVGHFAKSGFRLNRFAAEDGKRRGAAPPATIIARLRELAHWKERPPGIPAIAPLGDILVHNLDIRRPLGRPRPTPADAFALTAPLLRGFGFGELYFGSRRRIAGLRIVADDIDWSTGDGPEVHGSADAILLLMTNRPIGRHELSGDGADEIYRRFHQSR